MTVAHNRRRFTTLALAVSASLLGACSTLDHRTPVEKQVEDVRPGPKARPVRTITGFTESLRCMDSMLAAYGVRDVPVLVEDLQDQTKKLSVGARDMLISAVHEASARSQSIRLITFGSDVANLANFMANAESKRPYESLPVFDIRGSISQLDEGIARRQTEAGITLGGIGAGAAKTGDGSILALDLSVISARDYSAVPGVKASNSVLIYKEGNGVDGEAQYRKLGLNFGITLMRAEGKAQAVRSLVELAVVELIGKLAKVPYWTCLGADPQSDEVQHEITTWLYAMQATGELTGWFQQQLTVRDRYNGPVDGRSNAEFVKSLTQLRGDLGLSAEPVVDLDLLRRYLAKDHRTAGPLRVTYTTPVAARPPAPPPVLSPAPSSVPPTGPSSAAAAPTPDTAIGLKLGFAATATRAGEPVQLSGSLSADGHLVCWMQDVDGRVSRFFPNRFQPSSAVAAGAPVLLPGSMRFQITMPARGQRELIRCIATPDDITARLPRQVVGTDFEPLNVASLDALMALVRKSATAPVATAGVVLELR